MRSHLQFLALVATSLGVVNAGGNYDDNGCKTYTDEQCYTWLGPNKQWNVPTHTHYTTKTYEATSTKVVHPKTTVLATQKTVTSTVHTATTTTVAGVATTSTIEVDTTTSTDVSTVGTTISLLSYTTSTATSTLSTSSVVATTAGFVPILTSCTDCGAPAIDVGPGTKREVQKVEERHAMAGSLQARGYSPKPQWHQQYPQSVDCEVVVHKPHVDVVTKTGSTWTITAHPQRPTTITTTVSSTATSVSYPAGVTTHVTSTITNTNTHTLYPYTTVTSTLTTTSTYTTASTLYAQCTPGSNNFADHKKTDVTKLLGDWGPNPYDLAKLVGPMNGVTNAADCCAACQKTTGGMCAGSGFGEIGTHKDQCYLYVYPTGPGESTAPDAGTVTFYSGLVGSSSGTQWIVSNSGGTRYVDGG